MNHFNVVVADTGKNITFIAVQKYVCMPHNAVYSIWQTGSIKYFISHTACVIHIALCIHVWYINLYKVHAFTYAKACKNALSNSFYVFWSLRNFVVFLRHAA
jgi:hypothetical protein